MPSLVPASPVPAGPSPRGAALQLCAALTLHAVAPARSVTLLCLGFSRDALERGGRLVCSLCLELLGAYGHVSLTFVSPSVPGHPGRNELFIMDAWSSEGSSVCAQQAPARLGFPGQRPGSQKRAEDGPALPPLPAAPLAPEFPWMKEKKSAKKPSQSAASPPAASSVPASGVGSPAGR